MGTFSPYFILCLNSLLLSVNNKNLYFLDFFLKSLLIINVSDIFLINLVGLNARWYQLHSLINFLICYRTFNDTLGFFIYPLENVKIIEYNFDQYLIINLHLYHFLTFANLSKMDYFHHIFFVLFGVFPISYYFNYNLVSIFYFTGCGLTGFLEYGMLTLVKNNYLKKITQKKYTQYLYNFVRYPLCLYSTSLVWIHYRNDLFITKSSFLIMYLIFISFSNSSIFNLLTIKSYCNCVTFN